VKPTPIHFVLLHLQQSEPCSKILSNKIVTPFTCLPTTPLSTTNFTIGYRRKNCNFRGDIRILCSLSEHVDISEFSSPECDTWVVVIDPSFIKIECRTWNRVVFCNIRGYFESNDDKQCVMRSKHCSVFTVIKIRRGKTREYNFFLMSSLRVDKFVFAIIVSYFRGSFQRTYSEPCKHAPRSEQV